MLIQPENEKMDRGQWLFKKYPGAINSKLNQQKNAYFQSKMYEGFKHNCKQMDQFIDNDSTAVSNFISDITPPTIRRAYNEFCALFTKFLETDPLFNVQKLGDMKEEQASAIQKIINDNINKTGFREKCLSWNIDDIMRYGTSVTYSFATNEFNANSMLTLKSSDDEKPIYGDYKQVTGAAENVAVSTPIHPLNTIVDPKASYQSSPNFMGFLGDINVSSLAKLKDNPAYIQKNLQEVIDMSRTALPDKNWYAGEDAEVKDFSRGHGTIVYMWTRLPIEGNEDDPTWYACESMHEKTIRIEENPLDENTIPIAIQRVFPRKYEWCGNSPLADKVCIQNLQYWLINTTVESTARLMDRIILYREGTMDVEAINQRHTTGGMVPYAGQEPDLKNLIHGVNLPAVGDRQNNWLMQEMRREDQETSMIPNFNPQSQGGPTNKTLGGAQMMASIGEMRAAYLVGQMCMGMKAVPKHQLVLMRNISDNTIKTEAGEEFNKELITGKNISFYVKTSNVLNYIMEGTAAENRLQVAINRRATKIPQFMAVRLKPLIVDSLRNNLKKENIDEYVDMELLTALDEKDTAMLQQSINPAPAPAVPPLLPPGPEGAPMEVPAPITQGGTSV